MPLISVDALKKLVYEKSGYQMQLASGEDPLLTTIYINQAVLGQAIEYATNQMLAANEVHIQKLEQNYKLVIGQLQDARKGMADAGKSQPSGKPISGQQEQIEELSQLHLGIKTLPDSLWHTVNPAVKAMKEESAALQKVLADLPETVKSARIESMLSMTDEMGELIGLATEKTRLDASWKAAAAMASFGTLMVACGVYVGDSRAGWASPVAFGAICALGLVAGIAIGYVVSSTLREKLIAHAHAKAFWNDPARRAWYKRNQDAMRS